MSDPRKLPACGHCEEPLLPYERQVDHFHLECISRMILGSVGHQLRRCPCHGGTEEDPPGVSKREAPRQAYAVGLLHHARAEKARLN